MFRSFLFVFLFLFLSQAQASSNCPRLLEYQGHKLRVYIQNGPQKGLHLVSSQKDLSHFQHRVLSGGPLADTSMTSHLLKSPNKGLRLPMSALHGLTSSWGRITQKASHSERYEFIKEFLLNHLMTNPGHIVLRNSSAIESIAEDLKANENLGADKKITINLVTHQYTGGLLRSVDLWDGHHRLMAYMMNQAETLAHISSEYLKILVDGVPVGETESIPHRLPTHGINFSAHPEIIRAESTKWGTILLPGELSNTDLGSRTTAELLYDISVHRSVGPSVGVIITKNMEDLHLEKLNSSHLNYDEIVILMDSQLSAEEAIRQMNQALPQIENLSRLNLYIGDTAAEVNMFDHEPLLYRVGQLYGARSVDLIE